MAYKIIDDKGLLFGMINIIDFFTLLFVVCFLPTTLYYSWKIYSRQFFPPPLTPITAITIPIKEYEELREKKLQVIDFLKEHKKAKKYFRKGII